MSVLLLTAGATGLLQLFGGRTPRPPSSAEVVFGPELRESEVEALLAAVSRLPRRAVLVAETYADEQGIRHLLRAEQGTLDSVAAQLRGIAPGTRIEIGKGRPATTWALGARLSWRGAHPLLREDALTETSAALLGTLVGLARDEALLLQVALRPGRPGAVPPPDPNRGNGHGPTILQLLVPDRRPDPHHVQAVRTKHARPLVRARVLVCVTAGHRKRAEHLLARVIAVIRSRRGARGSLAVHRLGPRATARALETRPRGGDLLTAGELAAHLAWPIGGPRLPGLRLGGAPQLLPDPRIPTQERPLGRSTWPGMEQRALTQPVRGALSHTLIAGPTGSGKSALMSGLVLADAADGRGALVLDGKGDLVEDILRRLPPQRAHDVIVLDPAEPGPVPGLRVFGRGGDPELTADLVLGVLRDLFASTWGVRSDQWLRAGLVTLAHDPKATLGDLPYLFSDDRYRRKLVGKLNDPLLQATWAAFEAMKPAERSNQLGAPLQKLSELLGRRVLRTVLSQTKPALDLSEAIRRNRIVLVSLSPGRLGAPAARLLGALVVYQLLVAVQARASLTAARRRPFFAYIDEPKVLGDIPVPLDGIFELARGLGVGLTLAVQSLSQLSGPVRTAALTNAATLIAFRQTADDAELLARHLSGVNADALQQLDAFEIVARIGLGGGEIAAPASGRTSPPGRPISDPATIRRLSAARYGADRSVVDQALAARHATGEVEQDDGPVGRTRRKP